MATKFIEKCRVLCDMGTGLLSRFYLLKRTLASPGGRPHSLQNTEWQKVRKQLERSPSDPGDLSKIQGYESFRQASGAIIDELRGTYDILVDMLDFKEATLAVLKDIPREILEFKLSTNRSIFLAFFDTLLSYVRVCVMFVSVEERIILAAIYNITHTYVHGSGDEYATRVFSLLNSFDQPMKHMVEEFQGISQIVGDMILCFGPVFRVAFDPDGLRSRNILNPLEEGDSLPLPSNKPLAQGSDLSIYMELMHFDKYIEYTIFGGLVFPAVLFRPEVFEVFKVAMQDGLRITVFRDMNLNPHEELEALAAWFPPKGHNFVIPKNFKLKSVGKEIAKEAACMSGLAHRERRSFLRGELANLRNLLIAIPGLLGPKFPMVISAISMARQEILWYFSHQGLQLARRNNKHITPEHYDDPQISVLLGTSHELIEFVRNNQRIVQLYNAEYLKTTDYNALGPLLAAVGPQAQAFGGGIAVIFNQIPGELERIQLADISMCNFEPFRLNWDRAVTCISGQRAQAFKTEPMVALCKRMNAVYQRTLFVDALPYVLGKYGELWNLWWFQDELMVAFRQALQDAEAGSKYVVAFLFLAASAMNNVHTDCPEEQMIVGESSGRIAEQMLNEITTYVEDLMKPLWEHFQSLDRQIAPIEAALRVERMQQAKQGRGNTAAPADHMPGYESQGWARKHIEPLVVYQRNLANILAAIKRVPLVVVFNREMRPTEHVKERIAKLFKTQMETTMMKDGYMERPSKMMFVITQGCRAMQFALSKLDANLPLFMRQILYAQLVDTTMPPPGSCVPLDITPKDTIVFRFANWFSQFVIQASQEGSGIVWMENKKCFGRLNKTGMPAEMYVELIELRSLTDIIGPQGVRVIDWALLRLISSKITEVKRYIGRNEALISEFRQKFTQSSWATITARMEDTPAFLSNSVCIGMALAMREILHEALGVSQRLFAPFVQSAAKIATASVEPRVSYNTAQGVACLAVDSGTIVHPDLSLMASLRHICANSEDQRLLDALPMAHAAAYHSDYWKRAQFIPSFDAFSNNEHAIAFGLSKLLLVFHSREGNPTALQQSAQAYIQASAFVLLRMRMAERTDFREYPTRAMIVMLEKFVQYCPDVDRSTLERFVPYAVLHASHVEVSLGKQRALDAGHEAAMSSYSDTVDSKDA